MATAPQQVTTLSQISPAVRDWVAQVAGHTKPDRVHWCDGSEEEFQALRQELVSDGEL